MTVSEATAASLADAVKVAFETGTSLQVAQELAVGRSGQGTLEAEGPSASLAAGRLVVGDGIGAVGSLHLRLGSAATVSAVSAAPHVAVGIDGGHGLVELDGGQLTLPATAAPMLVGSGGGRGEVQVGAGGALDAAGAVHLGVGSGAQGRLVVEQAGSTASVAALTAGLGGAGTVQVTGGGVLDQPGASSEAQLAVAQGGAAGTATASVQGAGSRWSFARGRFGVDGTAATTVADGGRLQAGADLVLGVNAAGRGELAVAGVGSQANVATDLAVGAAGQGGLAITAGGTATVGQNLWLGRQAGNSQLNEATVDGAGSLLSSTRIHVGDFGRGRLAVTGGGAVQATNFVVAQEVGSQGTATVDGPGSRLTANALGVSTFGNGSLTIAGGGLVEAGWRFWTGFASPGTATVAVDGPGSALRVGGGTQADRALLIGGEPTFSGGQGVLTVSGGGRLAAVEQTLLGPNAAANGKLVVTGGGSLADFTALDARDDLLAVGDRGVGTVEVRAGGELRSERSLVGRAAGAVGSATATGTGSSWTARWLAVGEQGSAALAVADGARLTTTLDAYLARQAGSTAQATIGGAGATARWEIGDGLYVGGDQGAAGGAATLAIPAHGRVEVAQDLQVWPQGDVRIGGGALVVGGEARLKGPLALDGGEAAFGLVPSDAAVDFQGFFDWNAGALRFTAQGLLLDDGGPLGGAVNVLPGKTLAAAGLDNRGLLNVVGSSAVFRGGASTNRAAGTINVSGGALEVAEGLANYGAVSLFDATVVGDVTHLAGSNGSLGGVNAVSGGYAMAPLHATTVRVRSATNASRLTAGQTASLDGTLNLALVGAYVPSLGTKIPFVAAAAVAGEFAAENLPKQIGGTAFYVQYAATAAALLATHPTDFTADGEVAGEDFARWEKGFGLTSTTYKRGDADEDGLAGGRDLLAWQRQFGLAVPAATAAVPEPSALLVAALGGLGLLAARRALS